jgi:membrane fusion protein, multidrug efflux system
MKTTIYSILIVGFLASCGGDSKPGDKKVELEKLKSQQSELEAKIIALEAEVAKTDTSAANQKPLEVTTMPLTTSIFKTYIEIQGNIDADENVALSTEMPGTITKINVKVGDEVSRGQVLAETDTRAIQTQIADLQTNLDLAKQVYEKQESLWNQKIGTEIQYLSAKTAKESLEKKMSSIGEQIRMGKIISPINGTVDGVNIKIGQGVAPGLPAINVVNFSNLKVKANVAESYAARVKTGNEVRIIFPDMNDSITSKVNYASRAINSLNRTFEVQVLLDNKKEYHPNMVAKLKINDYQSAKPQIVVPIKFIQKSATKSYVLIVEAGKAVKKDIVISHEYYGMAEISSGLNEGDQIITEGYDLVNDGDNVTTKK